MRHRNQNRRYFRRRRSSQTYAKSLSPFLFTVTTGSPVIFEFERDRQRGGYPDQDLGLRGEVEIEVERMFTGTAKDVRNRPATRRVVLQPAAVQHVEIGVVL